MTRNSDNDPIRVDFVSQEAHGLPGRLGLTFAPGKCGPGLTATWARDLATDLTRLRDTYGARVLVSLIETHEMERMGIPDLRSEAERAGLRSLWFPIVDVSVPATPEAPIPLVRDILAHLGAGETVVVHCMGGIGRAGTISACALAARGLGPAEAIAKVRAARPGTLETFEQEAFVSRFAEAWNRASASDDGSGRDEGQAAGFGAAEALIAAVRRIASAPGVRVLEMKIGRRLSAALLVKARESSDVPSFMVELYERMNGLRFSWSWAGAGDAGDVRPAGSIAIPTLAQTRRGCSKEDGYFIECDGTRIRPLDCAPYETGRHFAPVFIDCEYGSWCFLDDIYRCEHPVSPGKYLQCAADCLFMPDWFDALCSDEPVPDEIGAARERLGLTGLMWP